MARSKNTRDEALAKLWQKRIKAGQKKKAEYDEAAKEVMQYFKAQHQDFYKDMAQSFMKFSGGAVSVNKSAQIRGVLGPHLYQQNPKCSVTNRSRDGIMRALARVLSVYLNYTPEETNLERAVRRGIDDSLLRGRGFLRTGWDDRHELVTSWYVSSMDVVVDPDFDCLEDAKWLALRRRVPIYDLKRQLGKKEKWRLSGLTEKIRGKSSAEIPDAADDDLDDDRDRASPTNDLVEYWEVWSKCGIGWRFSDADEEYKNHNDDADYVKVSVCLYHDTLLEEGDWEVPLYLDNEWPLVELDLVETLDELWPTSLFSQSLSHQKVIDLVSSLELAKLKTHARQFHLVSDEVEDLDVERIRNGGTDEVIRVKIKQNSGKRLNDLIYSHDTGMVSPELSRARDWHEREMGMTTGMTSVLAGGVDPGAQERSATAVQLKKEASNTRLGDFQTKTERWVTRARRNEALCVRLLEGDAMESDDVDAVYQRGLAEEERVSRESALRHGIQSVISQDQSADLGFLISITTDQAGEIPVRDRRDQVERERAMAEGLPEPLTLELIGDQFATYFSSPDEAMAALQAMPEAMSKHPSPVVQAAAGQLVVQVPDPMTGAPSMGLDPSRVEIRPATVEDLWRDTSGMSPKDMVREFSYTIASGSSRKVDPERKLELSETMVQQVLPIALQNMDYALANTILAGYYNALDMPLDERPPPLQPPPPPPQPMGAPAGAA